MARARSATADRAAEFIGLAAFAIATLTAISLLSYDPLDRSFFVEPAPSGAGRRNLAGAVGSNLSHALLLLLGLLAYAVPVALVAIGIYQLRTRAARPRRAALFGGALLAVSCAALLAVTVGQVPFQSSNGVVARTFPVPAGGIAGQALARGLASLLGAAGTLVVLLSTLAAGLLLTTPLSLTQILDRSFHHARSSWSRIHLAAWRWLDQHRKERERRALTRERTAKTAERPLRAEARRSATAIAPAAAGAATAVVVAAAARSRVAPEVPALGPADEVLLQAPWPEARPEPSPAARKVESAAPGRAPAEEARPALAPAAVRALSRDQAARAAAITLRLGERPADTGRRPSPDPFTLEEEESLAAARTALGDLPTPRDVAELAAQASGAIRKARQEKAAAEAKKKGSARAAADDDEDFSLPPISLLETLANDAIVTERELVENAKVLVSKLKEFAVEGTVQAIHPGPVVTTYEYRPDAGVKYSKIVGLADDLCLAMKAEGVRIDRISGKSAVGIEVPNSVRETIGLREMIEADAFRKSSSKLTLTLGKSINGEPYITDLRRMPHLLIAGATGSGKSVAVNCMIVSVLYKASPEEVRFIMVDPKRIELGVYDGIPHLLVPVVTDCRLASNALRWAVTEMENRYKRLASLGVRSLEQYNSYVRGPEAKKLAETQTPEELKPLPYLMIIIDELADLMMVAANDIEDSISRLAAMARAVGIHLILATQRPSVDVITGVIKANFPSRISFRVSSKVDSRTILDSNGAEMLLGRGDMLFMPPGSARLLRVHGAFISDGEVQRLVSYLKNQREPAYDDKVLAAPAEPEGEFDSGSDEMYDEAVRVVLETGQASVSHLQRRLRLGYSRAARLVDLMEMNGIVGPSQGAKGREILVDRARFLAQMGQ